MSAPEDLKFPGGARLGALPFSRMRFEAVDGDRRVTVEVPAAADEQSMAGARGLFRDMVEQMFRSGRAERARVVVGEAGDREGPTGVDPGRTSPTTVHAPWVAEATFGTPAVEGERTVVDDGMIEGAVGGMVLVEEQVGPPVRPAPPTPEVVPAEPAEPGAPCRHSSGWKAFGAGADGTVVLCELPAGHNGLHEGEGAGAPWSTAAGDKRTAKLKPPADTVAEHEADDAEPTVRLPREPQGPPPPIAPDRPPAREPAARLRPNNEPRPVQPTGRAAEAAEKMARFVEAYRMNDTARTATDRLQAAAKAAGISSAHAKNYLTRARKEGLLPSPLDAMTKAAGPIGKLPVPAQAEPDRSRTVVQRHGSTVGYSL